MGMHKMTKHQLIESLKKKRPDIQVLRIFVNGERSEIKAKCNICEEIFESIYKNIRAARYCPKCYRNRKCKKIEIEYKRQIYKFDALTDCTKFLSEQMFWNKGTLESYIVNKVHIPGVKILKYEGINYE